MGLFDRLFASGDSAGSANIPAKPKAKQEVETVFLEPDAASSLGDVNFMRRSNTIRRTFPGTASSPGNKERVLEVASMEAELKQVSPGLGGSSSEEEEEISLTGGVPKPVKKTFAKQISAAEQEKLRRGSAAAVNNPGGPAAIKQEKEKAEAAKSVQPAFVQQSTVKPGSIDPFKQMVKELNG
jgi:hypothetical protein